MILIHHEGHGDHEEFSNFVLFVVEK